MTELTGMMRRNPALFSGKFIEYITPKWLYRELDDEFHFDLDPCTPPDNPLGTKYFFTKEDDALSKRCWLQNDPPDGRFKDIKSIYINPPYGREITQWISSAWQEVRSHHIIAVMLLPARTDTKWFHEYIYEKHGIEIRFLRGRLKFEGVAKNTAPFPSMLAIFR